MNTRKPIDGQPDTINAPDQPGTAPHASPGSPQSPATLHDVMVQALVMEIEAVERYRDFADAMETHNNPEVALLFRTMAGYETRHAQQIMARMGWTEPPSLQGRKPAWSGFDAPEAAPIDAVHYLMQPWHALQLALASEQRAEAFFGALADAATDPAVRKAALEFQAEEAEHVALVRAWMEKVPPPDSNWAMDPDPPRYTD